MPAATKIEWADATWNAATGCTRVSPGCRRCYTERIATSPRFKKNFPKGFEVHPRADRIDAPTRWKTPKVIFVNSMSDLFHRQIPEDFLTQVWHTMTTKAPHHTYLILTKRPHRMLHTIQKLQLPLMPHIWLGFSAENQTFYDSRIVPVIRLAQQAPSSQVFFVSCEPLLGPIDLRLSNQESDLAPNPITCPISCPISWVIAGGESGPGATPMDLEWARSIRDQCQKTDIPFFLKQLGGHPSKRGGTEAVLDGVHHQQKPNLLQLQPSQNPEHQS